jgi:hypothetical protein
MESVRVEGRSITMDRRNVGSKNSPLGPKLTWIVLDPTPRFNIEEERREPVRSHREIKRGVQILFSDGAGLVLVAHLQY